MYIKAERYKEYWKVLEITDTTTEGTMYIEVSDNQIIEKIQYNLKNSISIYLLDDFDPELEVYNLYYNKSELEMYKIVKIDEMKRTFESGSTSNKLHGGSIEFTMIYYNIVIILNKLANNGFFFNDDKNELYLQILESGDESMISLLEDFLEYSDQLKKMSFVYEKMSNIIERIKVSDSVEDVDLIVKTFDDNKGLENYNMM